MNRVLKGVGCGGSKMQHSLIKPLWAGLLGALLMGMVTSTQANMITIDEDSAKATVDCVAGLVDPACEGVIGESPTASLSSSYADIYDFNPSDEETETNFLNSLIGAGTVNVADATKIDLDEDVSSYDFVTSAVWFTIKTGLGNSFFKNNGGEIDLSVVYQQSDGQAGAGAGISHVTFWGGETSRVPEPGSLVLLGLGLLSLGLIRHRQQS